MIKFPPRKKLSRWKTRKFGLRMFVSAAAVFALGATAAFLVTSLHARARAEKPDAASRAAFLQVYRVLTSPRCQNCHPAGESPLQGDDSHVHLQNVKRGIDGHG